MKEEYLSYLQPPRLNTHDLVKAVHVELPDEGGHVGVLVVVGEQGPGKL